MITGWSWGMWTQKVKTCLQLHIEREACTSLLCRTSKIKEECHSCGQSHLEAWPSKTGGWVNSSLGSDTSLGYLTVGSHGGHLTILTFTATHGSSGPKSFFKRLALLYYRHLNNKTSFYSSTNHFPFITYGQKSRNNIWFFMIFICNPNFLGSEIPSWV